MKYEIVDLVGIDNAFKEFLKRPWYSITYPSVFDNELVRYFWKRLCCPRGWHLWDEHDNLEVHDLFCDACEFTLHIDDAKTQAEAVR